MDKDFKKQDVPTFNRIPPHSEEAERGILGSVILDCHGVYAPVIGKFRITAESFYIPMHRLIWEAICALQEKAEAVDLVTLSNKMKTLGTLDKIGGATSLHRIVDGTPTSAHFEYYCEIVKKNEKRRDIIEACRSIERDAYECEDPTALAAEAASHLTNLSSTDDKQQSVEEVNEGIIDKFECAKKGMSDFVGWHLKGLCARMAGATKGKITTIAAKPGEGKSTFANGYCHFTAKQGKAVGVWSLEMTEQEWRMNMVGANLGLEVRRFTEGRVSDEEIAQFKEGLEATKSLPLYINDRTHTIEQLTASIRRAVDEKCLQLVVIDCLKDIVPSTRKGEKKHEEVTRQVNALNTLAKNCPYTAFILIHHLSRESSANGNKQPQLQHLSDSSALEKDSYAVLFVYQDPNIDGTPMEDAQTIIEVAKNRGGPRGSATVYFQKNLQRFRTDI